MAAPPPPPPAATSASASPSSDAILHLAGLHALAAAGFASTSRAASLTLSSAVAQYFRLVASTCVEKAALAGRSKVSAIDVVAALDDLGMHVGELYDWAGEQHETVFSSDGSDIGSGLEEYLRDGLIIQDPIAELQMVHEDDIPHDEEDSDHDEEATKSEPADEDEVMGDGEVVVKEERVETKEINKSRHYAIRHTSPDMSWLPPLPNSNSTYMEATQRTENENAPASGINAADVSVTATPAPIQSIADRYRRPISYASSQLAQTHPFTNPHHPDQIPSLPPAPTSLPNLISTYAATASEPSIALRQTDLRRQATDLLRLSIAPVDSYSPADTLSCPIPPIRASPIVPSHSDVLPQRFLPVNPRPNGLLSSLVQQMQSPHLPPALRERLTSLRPPIPQIRDSQPILYGEPIRGPDELILSKAKGKNIDSSDPSSTGEKEIWLSQTWDSGPKGIDKFGRGKLPSGKKVLISKQGEDSPRRPEGYVKPKEEFQISKSAPLKLRLPSANASLGSTGIINSTLPAIITNLNGVTSEEQITLAPNSSDQPITASTPISATPTSTVPTLKFKIGVKKEPNTPVEAATDAAAVTVQRNGH